MNREEERQKMINLADTIKGEINRMCVTHDLFELYDLCLYARLNISKLCDMREAHIKAERKEE